MPTSIESVWQASMNKWKKRVQKPIVAVSKRVGKNRRAYVMLWRHFYHISQCYHIGGRNWLKDLLVFVFIKVKLWLLSSASSFMIWQCIFPSLVGRASKVNCRNIFLTALTLCISCGGRALVPFRTLNVTRIWAFPRGMNVHFLLI